MMPETLQSKLEELSALILAQIPEVRAWPEGRLREWLTWYTVRDYLGVILRDGRVVGVGCARPILAGQEDRDYAADWQGDTIWIDLAVAEDRSATRDLWFLLVHRFGPRAFVGYTRAKRGGRNRREPFDRFINRFFRTP